MRAHAEAVIAEARAVADPHAAIALARTALKRAKTPGARKDVMNDRFEIEQARQAAAAALARAGATTEAKKVETPSATDIIVGLRATVPRSLQRGGSRRRPWTASTCSKVR